MVVNVEKLLKMVENGDFFKNLSKNSEMLKNVGENIKKQFALIFYTLNIRNIILTQSLTNVYCHF